MLSGTTQQTQDPHATPNTTMQASSSSNAPPTGKGKRRRGDTDDQDDGEEMMQMRKWIRVVDEHDDAAPTQDQQPLPAAPQQSVQATASSPPSTTSTATPTPARSRFECQVPWCKRRAPTQQAIERHVRADHWHRCGVPTTHMSRACCGRVFPSAHMLDAHLEEGHSAFFWARYRRGDSVFPCLSSQCRESFRTRAARIVHAVAEHKWDLAWVQEISARVAYGAEVLAPSGVDDDVDQMATDAKVESAAQVDVKDDDEDVVMADLEARVAKLVVPSKVVFGGERGRTFVRPKGNDKKQQQGQEQGRPGSS
ncbi:hypothetical protein GGF31_005736 [Allomyces arbusculus]|nr:hypothetical protein GGF31_005736 [Allomyces arbusculus]